MITPAKALLGVAVGYGTLAFYMSNFYYKNSSLREIYVLSDPNYGKIKIMEHQEPLNT